MLSTAWLRFFDPVANWTRYQRLLLAVLLLRGVTLLCILPPFEGWDEYQHVGYLVHLSETGRDPEPLRAAVPESLLRAMVAFPHPRLAVAQIGRVGALDYPGFWLGASRPVYQPPDPPIQLYQAQHASLYYRCVRPVFDLFGGVANLRTSISAVRAINVLLLSASVWLILRRVGRIDSDRRAAALFGLFLVVQPLFLLNSVRVASDPLAILLATIVVIGFMDFAPAGMLRRALGAGMLIGLAVLAKGYNLALVPFALVFPPLLAIRRRVSPARAAAAVALVLLGLVLVAGPYFARNLREWGALSPMQEHLATTTRPADANEYLEALGGVQWYTLIQRILGMGHLWIGGWSFLVPVQFVRDAYQWLLWLALFGWMWRLFLHKQGVGLVSADPAALIPVATWALCCYLAGIAYYAVQSYRVWGANLGNAWYAAPGLPWFWLIACMGALGWPRIGPLIAAVLVALNMAAEISGVWLRMPEFYVGYPLGTTALRRLASLKPAVLGPATLLVAATAAGLLFSLAAFCCLRGLVRRPSPSR